jgi:hypothetical protein
LRGALSVDWKRRRVSGYSRPEVLAKLDELRFAVAAGLPVGKDIKVGEWLTWYLENVAAHKSPSTQKGARMVVATLAPLKSEHLRSCRGAGQQQVVEAVLADGPHESFGEGHRSRRSDRCGMVSMPMEVNAFSKLAVTWRLRRG